MADYFRDLRPASLRGVSFDIESDDSEFTRRIVPHEFPGRDEPYHEDFGAAPDNFTIEAVVGGPDFIARADTLEKAIKTPGPATLIHPHYGNLQVIVLGGRRRQASNAVGEVGFTITLQRFGKPLFPTAASNTAAGLLSSSLNAFTAAASDFRTFFQATGLPDFVLEDAISRNNSFLGTLSAVLNKTGIVKEFPALDVLSGTFIDEAIGLYTDLMNLAAPARKPIIGKPSVNSGISGKSIVNTMVQTSAPSLSNSAPATTANQLARETNAQSLDFFHRLSSLAAGVGSVRFITFESREEALSIRDSLSDRLSTLRQDVGAAGLDQSWISTGEMLAALNRDINEKIGRLPKTVQVRPASVRSSLALANRLYGDNPNQIFARAADITRRNAVRHPGFVPPNPLEVLIDV